MSETQSEVSELAYYSYNYLDGRIMPNATDVDDFVGGATGECVIILPVDI